MENQHRQIKGYRELSQDEIDLMNRIKEQGADLDSLITESRKFDFGARTFGPELPPELKEAERWRAIAKTHLQQGLMALTRAVAKPEFF